MNTDSNSRRSFIGGSDAGIIMGSADAALIRLWREKRGEVEPEDLSGNLIVQLGRATETRCADRLKILAWDGSGLVLLWKRLEHGAFRWRWHDAAVGFAACRAHRRIGLVAVARARCRGSDRDVMRAVTN